MGSTRKNAKGEEEVMASDVQPAEAPNAGNSVENIGCQLWDPLLGPEGGWRRALGAGVDGAAAVSVPLTANGLLNKEGKIDRQRRNVTGQVALESLARTATASSGNITNYNWTKLSMKLNITSNPGGSRHLTVSVFDSHGGVVCRFPSVEGPRAFQLAPGLEVATPGNAEDALRENAVLPATFLIQVIPSDGESWTYEVIYDLMV